jgi:hypothetical protein
MNGKSPKNEIYRRQEAAKIASKGKLAGPEKCE